MGDNIIDAYCDYLAALGRPQTTISLRRSQIQHFANNTGIPPQDISYDDVLAFFSRHGWQAETRRSYRSGLRGFFAWMTASGHIVDNPIVELPQVRVPKSTVRSCPDDVYAAALATADERGRLILRLAAEAGLRRAEIAQVHRTDLRGTPGRYELLVHGKGAHERIVPINDDLAGRIQATDGWLFGSERGGHLHPRSVGVMASKLLGDATLHQLRHRFATRAYRGSRNLHAVQRLLGHSSLAMTERYLDLGSDELRDAMNAAA